MIEVRPATPGDAAGMGAVHVGVWQTAYAGILPDGYLASLSVPRHAAYYQSGILRGHLAFVAEEADRVVGFATGGVRRGSSLGQSEIETLYVGEDWREQGAGRALMQRAGEALAGKGAASVFLWVLSDNPSRWFYQHMGGRRAAEGQTSVAGTRIGKTAFVWDPIELLLSKTARGDQCPKR